MALAARRNQSTWLCYVTGYRLGLCRRSGGDQEGRLAAADGVGRRVTERTVARALAGAACEEKWGPLGSLAEGGRGPCFSTWGKGGGGCKVRLFQIPKLFPYFVTSVRFLTTCPHPPPLHPPPFSSTKLSFSDRKTFFLSLSFFFFSTPPFSWLGQYWEGGSTLGFVCLLQRTPVCPQFSTPPLRCVKKSACTRKDGCASASAAAVDSRVVADTSGLLLSDGNN